MEQQEFMKFLIEDALAQGLQIQTEDDVKSYLEQLGEEGIKAKYQQFTQMKGQTLAAKLGTKLNYIKQLKGDCLEGEELIYFKKGGMICKACEKKKQGEEVKQPKKKVNPVENFKNSRKSKLDESKHIKRFVRHVTDKMKYELGDPYALNRIHNNRYRDLAEDNKVTGLNSFIRELELRWMANPNLGGKPEGPTLWDKINRPFNPTVNFNNIVTKFLKN